MRKLQGTATMTRKKRPQSRRKAQPAQPVARQKMTRRDMLGLAKFGAMTGAVVLGGGYYFVSSVMAGIAESDLSKLGNGIPTIVQVHDPGCPSCRILQRQARAALENFDEDDIQYLVANLDSQDGRRFAGQYAAGRVTLLLFDGQGRLRDRVQGETPEPTLTAVFQRHLRRSARRDQNG